MTNPLTISLRSKLTPVMAEVNRMAPMERAYASGRLLLECQAGRQAFAEIRRVAINEMHAEGATWQQIGDLLGMSKQKAHVYSQKARVLPSSGDL